MTVPSASLLSTVEEVISLQETLGSIQDENENLKGGVLKLKPENILMKENIDRIIQNVFYDTESHTQIQDN